MGRRLRAALIFIPPRTWRDATGGVDGGSAPDVGHRNWKVVRQFVSKPALAWSTCELSARLGFVLKRPKKRLVKAQKREAFVAEYGRTRRGYGSEDLRRFPGRN